MSTEVNDLVAQAVEAAPALAASTDAERAAWLNAIADALDAAADELVPIAMDESHLPEARLRGEVGRTTGQLRLFATVVSEGSYLEAIIDHAKPESTPPQPELRRFLIPVGPVAVYSASNFPFAFSVAGGDTASALAVGCPVIVKAHSGHLKLSRATAAVVQAALTAAGAPAGTFALIEGQQAGRDLIQHPGVTAGAFTGGLFGGRALFDLASGRPAPIPFYGELGSINPVVITPAAVTESRDNLAAGLAASFTLGVGQFCTKPGLVLIPARAGFEEAVVAATANTTGGPMLNDRIASALPETLGKLAGHRDVTVLAGPADQDASNGEGVPVVLRTTAKAVAADPETLLEECFGPVTLLVAYDNEEDRDAALRAVGGALTATVHAAAGEDVSAVTTLLSQRAGRVLFGGWPTGVAVTWSQQHGGPWPATTSLHTSVGATAVRRFQRPITFQDAPESVLPDALKEANPLGIPRRVDGKLVVS